MRDWREVGCFHLGRLILDKFEILSSTDLVLVLGEVLSSVICGAEAVHQHEGQILALLTILPLHQHHLLGNKVQKCIVAFDRQQRFGLVEPHPSAKASIQLHHHSLGQQLWVFVHLQFLVLCHVFGRFDLGLGHCGGSALDKFGVVGFEGFDSSVVEPGFLHLVVQSLHLRRFFWSCSTFLKLLVLLCLFITTSAGAHCRGVSGSFKTLGSRAPC